MENAAVSISLIILTAEAAFEWPISFKFASLMNASIITIGDELLIGQTVDTNSAFISSSLNEIGIWVTRRVAVGDDKEDIIEAIASETKRSSIVIVTGGLGPTADDITKPALCAYYQCGMVMDEKVKEHVAGLFRSAGRILSERNIRQAEIPSICTVLENKRGTAPGLWFEKEGKILAALPGVPAEMKTIMECEVIPRLKQLSGRTPVVHKTLLTAGAPESTIADALMDFEKDLPPGVSLAYLPSYGMVRLRLTSRQTGENAKEDLLNQHFLNLQQVVMPWLVSNEDLSMEEVVNKLLAERNQTLATAESCTGGNIAHLLTTVPGSSRIFKGSVVAYSNDVKVSVLGVRAETIEKHGAVSEETVREMAAGLKKIMGTGYALATSGIMGPGGGSALKPVGTVWLAVAGEKNIKVQKLSLRFDREKNIEMASLAALNLLRKFLLENQ